METILSKVTQDLPSADPVNIIIRTQVNFSGLVDIPFTWKHSLSLPSIFTLLISLLHLQSFLSISFEAASYFSYPLSVDMPQGEVQTLSFPTGHTLSGDCFLLHNLR